jgi:hypothetical protein
MDRKTFRPSAKAGNRSQTLDQGRLLADDMAFPALQN